MCVLLSAVLGVSTPPKISVKGKYCIPTFLPAASVIIDHGHSTHLLPGNTSYM